MLGEGESIMAKRVLCIDDDPGMLMITAKGLERQGFAVTAAAGNDEALAHLERDPEAFDIVVQDSQRPLGKCLAEAGEPDDLHELSGVLFLRNHIWRLNPRLPCIFVTMTPRTFIFHEEPSLEGNPLFRYLMKPSASTELAAAVHEVLAEA